MRGPARHAAALAATAGAAADRLRLLQPGERLLERRHQRHRALRLRRVCAGGRPLLLRGRSTELSRGQFEQVHRRRLPPRLRHVPSSPQPQAAPSNPPHATATPTAVAVAPDVPDVTAAEAIASPAVTAAERVRFNRSAQVDRLQQDVR